MKRILIASYFCLAFAVVSCQAPPLGWLDRSIVYTNWNGATANGRAYDKATIGIGSFKKLVLPEAAEVRPGGTTGEVQIFMKKTLGFYGVPSESVSIKTSRKKMGCVAHPEEGKLAIATFGEFDSHIEGGTSIELLFVVPDNVEVERAENLSGENSVGRHWSARIPDSPDAEHTVDQKKGSSGRLTRGVPGGVAGVLYSKPGQSHLTTISLQQSFRRNRIDGQWRGSLRRATGKGRVLSTKRQPTVGHQGQAHGPGFEYKTPATRPCFTF